MNLFYPDYDDTRYPDGVQDFSTLRENNMVYVDKTAYIYRLVRKPVSYFLSRPRRFGKSLLLSTIEAYFQGRKELFQGLAINDLEKDWTRHPVIRIDLSQGVFSSVEGSEERLRTQLRSNARKLQIELTETTPDGQFQELIETAFYTYGKKVVVLIDEYDKPILETKFESDKLHKDVQDLMRGFFGCLKGNSEFLRFVMLTGITKLSHVNIFSGLNNLTDISLQPWCNSLCGISESEMQAYFANDMKIFADINNLTPEQVQSQFRHYYDGYRFAKQGENIYNPYSVILAFQNMEFANYWFTTGTPSHLIRSLINEDFDFNAMNGCTASAEELMGIPTTDGNPVGLLYQSGYLTIKNYEDEVYTLGFPNKEVESGFYDILLQMLFPQASRKGYSAINVRKAAQQGDPDQLVQLLDMALIDYCYDQHKDIDAEAVLNSILFGLVHAIGLNVKAEYHTSNGRIDLTIETRKYIYLFEFKINKSASAALKQINNVGYATHYKHDSRKLFKIGLNFNTKLRGFDDVLIE